MIEHDEGTYEMLWNCPYCGTKKLLGLTHRHCPVCGAKQDPDARYFPSDEDKVAVKDHQYFGADKACPACGNPQSAKSTYCGNCGSPMEGAGEVKRVVEKAAPAKPVEKPGKKKTVIGLVVALAIIAVAAVAVIFLWKKEVGVTVKDHTWTRAIGIEVFSAVKESDWCDHMPRDARNVSRSREVRSHKKVPDGEDCTTKRVDKGDGTYTQKRVCTTKYKEEPVYDDKCRYTVERWVEKRKETASGRGLASKPAWPAVKLTKKGTSLGSQREGQRTETYTLVLVDSENKEDSCDLPMDKWASMPQGSRWAAQKSVITGSIDCDSIQPVSAR